MPEVVLMPEPEPEADPVLMIATAARVIRDERGCETLEIEYERPAS